MSIHRLPLLLLLLLVLCSSVLAQQISHEELVEILGIKSWRVPMPKDESLEWSIKLVDFEPRKYTAMNAGRLSPQKKALIALRDMGKDTYRFTLKQIVGTSQGDLEISICPEKEKAEGGCDNSYSIEWFDVPKPYDDGVRFVIADIEPMLGPDKPTKQLVLVPTHYRAEDIIKEQLPKR